MRNLLRSRWLTDNPAKREDVRKKISDKKKGKHFGGIKIITEKFREKMREINLGRKASEESKKRMSMAQKNSYWVQNQPKGKDNPLWKGGSLARNRKRKWLVKNVPGSHTFGEWENLKAGKYERFVKERDTGGGGYSLWSPAGGVQLPLFPVRM